MSRIARIVSVALFPLLGLLTVQIAGEQSSPKSSPEQKQGEMTADKPYVPTLTYDVASVREAHIDGWPGAGFTMSHDGHLNQSSIRLTNWNIENLLWLAYDVRVQQISGLPRWPVLSVFVIQAKG